MSERDGACSECQKVLDALVDGHPNPEGLTEWYEAGNHICGQLFSAADASELDQLRTRVAQLSAALDRDRTGLGAALNRIRQTTQAYAWIPAGEWGAYDYAHRDCETLRREMGQCLEEIYTTAVQALQASGVQATQTLLNLKVDHVPKR